MLTALSTLMLFVPQRFYGATASIGVDCGTDLGAISPYVYGQNSAGIYYEAPMTDPNMINTIKEMGITAFKFPPGSASQRYDFKYNNYSGREWWGGGTPAPEPGEWDDTRPSLEDEFRFCNAVEADPIIGVNVAFCGPDGTGINKNGVWMGGGDLVSYGMSLPDTAQKRAQHAADMVSYMHSLCDVNGWEYPVYYDIGNEWYWDGPTAPEYCAIYRECYTAMKAVDPNIVLNSAAYTDDYFVQQIGDILDTNNFHLYSSLTGSNYDDRITYYPGTVDGTFYAMFGENVQQTLINSYTNYWPSRDVVFVNTEWGDHWGTASQFSTYRAGIFAAHVLFRHIKNKYVISAPWYLWSSNDTIYHLFGGPPEFKMRPRGFIYKVYKNFGDSLLEAIDSDEGDSLIAQASKRSDGSTAIIVINLSETVTYDTQISLANFAMSGEIEVHTMNNSNCYEGGPGPSMSTLTQQSSPVNYTFAPWTVTCLVVKGESDVPVITNVASGNITETGATITWDTDRASTSQAEYGTTISYGSSTTEDSNLVLSHSVDLTGLMPGTEYHYRVICKDSENKGSMSIDYKFTTLGTGGIDVKVYPNPVSGGGQITFSVGAATGGEVKVYTVSGKLVKELAIGTGESEVGWDVLNEDGNSITAGLYLYTITDGAGNKKTGKLAISH
jgi:hypothetical protein